MPKKSTIVVMRYSGTPVSLANLELWKAEWTLGFDIAKAKHGNEMLGLQKDLAELEEQLKLKYPVVEQWPILSNKKVLLAKIDEVGAPIMAARSSDGKNELVYIIMDQEFST